MLVDILSITDDAKCYEMVHHLRWPDGVRWPRCDAAQVVKQGRDDTEPLRRRYERCSYGRRFDDLADTIFAGHHQPRRVRALVLYFVGLNLSKDQTAKELDLDPDDARRMTTSLRDEVVPRRPEVVLGDEVECYGAHVVAGGTRPGLTYGEPDDPAMSVARDPVHDFHATPLHQMGLGHARLTYRHHGRDFLMTDVEGRVVNGVLA